MQLKYSNDNQLCRTSKGNLTLSQITNATVTVLMIQKRCSSTVHYKNRHSSVIIVTDKRPHHNNYYSKSPCIGDMLFCNTRTVTWLAATSTNEISAADVFGQNRDMLDKRGSNATDATMLENVHKDVWWRSNIDLSMLSSGEHEDVFDNWHTLGTMIYSLNI